MLNEHTHTQLRGLRLDGMVRAIEEHLKAASKSAVAGISHGPAESSLP
jgi:hypothetical protein